MFHVHDVRTIESAAGGCSVRKIELERHKALSKKEENNLPQEAILTAAVDLYSHSNASPG
jgi:hypothetical protein